MKYNWRKSSYSNAEGNCVEVGHGQDAVLVRDTKNRDIGHLAVDLDAWRRFVTSVKDQVRLGTHRATLSTFVAGGVCLTGRAASAKCSQRPG